MKLRFLLLISTIALTTLFTACGGTETPANNANMNSSASVNSNANGAKPAANDPTAVTTPTPDQITNNAPTLTPVYKAYCAAVVKKDEAAIRKYFDSATLKNYEEQMKDAGIRRLSEFVDPVTNEICEVSNERFNGDKAVARVITKSYAAPGFEILWIKENGEWKMSNMKPEKGFQ